MTTSSDKQLLQVNNILQTLLEATEHFHKLIKEKELNQSIFIFSSIVEGFGAVGKIDVTPNKLEWTRQMDKMEKYLLDIAQLMEKGHFVKISEILQFSLIPLLKKMHKETAAVGEQAGEKIYTIGVFSPHRNPRDFYTEERVNALISESTRQNTQLLFFTSGDVDFDKKEISADVYSNGKWERITAPFPDVINNVGGGRRTHVDRKLRREIPFTSFHVGNKFTLPKRMVQYRKYAELLVPFQLCRNEVDIHDFMEKNNKVVFKYLSGNRGENIYFVTKRGSRYAVTEHKKERILGQDAFNKWLQNVVLREKGSFIIQRYIHTRTKADEPYHIRAHVQKNGDGEWALTHIYPRVGNKKSNLSNVATDGRVEDFYTFLEQEYGEKGATYEQDILRLSMELAHHLDKLYNLALDELGIDFAIDENGRYWMHEANNGPQTAYHEEKRAVNTIAYAKYIAKNGIFYAGNTGQSGAGRFQARTSQVPLVEPDDCPMIGILTGKIVSDPLAMASVKAAEAKDMQLYAFTPNDIDFDEMLIRGYFYENEEWVPKIVQYPDVIFDRFKLRGDTKAQWIYEELEDIPFTNEWPGRLHKRSEIYEKLQATGEWSSVLPTYQTVGRPRDIFRYLETFGKVLLTPEIGAFQNAQYIEKRDNGKYTVTKGTSVKEYSELPLRNALKDLLKKENFIIQKDSRSIDTNGQPFTVRVHLMLDGKAWKFVSLHPNGKSDATTEIEDLLEFLQHLYGEDRAANLEYEIKSSSGEVAVSLQSVYGDLITEVAIILGIDENQQLNLNEVNPNGPERIYDAEKMADGVMGYAEYLATLNTVLQE